FSNGHPTIVKTADLPYHAATSVHNTADASSSTGTVGWTATGSGFANLNINLDEYCVVSGTVTKVATIGTYSSGTSVGSGTWTVPMSGFANCSSFDHLQMTGINASGTSTSKAISLSWYPVGSPSRVPFTSDP